MLGILKFLGNWVLYRKYVVIINNWSYVNILFIK